MRCAEYSLLSLAVASALAAPAAFAQEQAQPGDPALEQITVTGSRIRRADYTSPTPTTTVDGEYLHDLGLVSVGDALTQNPTNVSRFQPSTTGSGSFFVGTTMANLRGLNPYFGTRTLTLVDSMRHVADQPGRRRRPELHPVGDHRPHGDGDGRRVGVVRLGCRRRAS